MQGFLERPLEGDWPHLWLDATCVKVRQGGRIVPVAVTVAVAVNSRSRREVLGMAIGTSEAETFWTDFLRSLARRGLPGVQLVISDVISDDHKGLKAAIQRVLHTAFVQESAESASAQWRQIADQLRPSWRRSWTRPSTTCWRT